MIAKTLTARESLLLTSLRSRPECASEVADADRAIASGLPAGLRYARCILRRYAPAKRQPEHEPADASGYSDPLDQSDNIGESPDY